MIELTITERLITSIGRALGIDWELVSQLSGKGRYRHISEHAKHALVNYFLGIFGYRHITANVDNNIVSLITFGNEKDIAGETVQAITRKKGYGYGLVQMLITEGAEVKGRIKFYSEDGKKPVLYWDIIKVKIVETELKATL